MNLRPNQAGREQPALPHHGPPLRALWVSAITLVFFVGYGAIPLWVRSNERIYALVDPAMLDLFQSVAWGSAAGWMVFVVRGLKVVRSGMRDQVYASLVVHFYAVSNMLLVYCVGVISVVAGLFVFGALAAGLLVFGARQTVAGLASGIATVALATGAGRLGLLPSSGLLDRSVASTYGHAPEATYAQLIIIGGLTAVFVAVLLWLFARAQR